MGCECGCDGAGDWGMVVVSTIDVWEARFDA